MYKQLLFKKLILSCIIYTNTDGCSEPRQTSQDGDICKNSQAVLTYFHKKNCLRSLTRK